MKALMLGACLAAVLGAPVLAQPDDQGGYQNDHDPYYDQAQPDSGQYDRDDRGYDQGDGRYDQGDGRYDQDDRTYQGDHRYDRDNGVYDRDDDYGRTYGYRREWRAYGDDLPAGAHFTGRTGAAWRNAQGQSCAWRQMAWYGSDGRPAYRWIERCHG